MLFAANISVEQEVIVAAIITALLYLHASDVQQHKFNRRRVATSLQDPESRSRSAKVARIWDVDLVRFFSDWLTYAADNVKARVLQSVWKMFGF